MDYVAPIGRARVAPRAATSGHSSIGGYSLIEVMISATLLMLMVYVVSALTIRGSDAQKYAERLSRVTEITQGISDDVRAELRSSVRIFFDDADGNTFRGMLNWDGIDAPIDARLPGLAATGTFEPDTAGNERTGNSLFFAKHAWSTRFEATSGRSFRIDVYRFVCYYLKPEAGGAQVGSPVGLNLAKWVGEPMADGEQIDGVADPTDLQELLSHLANGTPDSNGVRHPEVSVAWLRNEDPAAATTLRQIRNNGTLRNDPTSPRRTPWEIERSIELSNDGMLYYRHHSVATNFAGANFRVAQFGLRDASGDGFPHGLELQVIGPASARQVMFRLTVSSTNRRGHPAFTTMQTIVDARDL